MARPLADVVAPGLADDQQFLQFLAKAMRSSVNPGAAMLGRHDALLERSWSGTGVGR